MENQDSAYFVQQWMETDEELAEVLVEIQEMPLSVEEQAEVAFHRLSELYNLPKMPEDIIYDDEEDEDGNYYHDPNADHSDDDYEPSSVYQELGVMKYLAPDDDPRGRVLTAIWAVKNKVRIDLEQAYEKARSEGINDVSGIGFRGVNSGVELVIIRKEESWVEAGCVLFIRPA